MQCLSVYIYIYIYNRIKLSKSGCYTRTSGARTRARMAIGENHSRVRFWHYSARAEWGFLFVRVLRLFVALCSCRKHSLLCAHAGNTHIVFHFSKLLASVSLLSSFPIIWFSSSSRVCVLRARFAKHENRFYYVTPAMQVNSLNETLLAPLACCFYYKN